MHLHCVRAFVWLCMMRCIVRLAALRLLLRDWLCCCAAVLRSCPQHLAALLTLLTDADARFTVIIRIANYTILDIRSVIALVIWNVALHVFVRARNLLHECLLR